MPRAAWRAWREAPELAEARMVCCARHTPAPTDETVTERAYLVAGICEMTASATSRIPSRRSMAVF